MHMEDTNSGSHVIDHMWKWKLMNVKAVICGCMCYGKFVDHTGGLASSLRLYVIHDPCINQIHNSGTSKCTLVC
jgi:hypothetical protein